MTIDKEELAESLYSIAEMLETRCRVASDPLAVVDSMVEELRAWVARIEEEGL